MGREIKRVPLNFSWPKDEVWIGYLNPHYKGHCSDCKTCKGNGSSAEAKYLQGKWYGYVPFKPEDRGSVPWTPLDKPVREFAERNVSHSPSYYGAGERAIVAEAFRLCDLWNKLWSHHLNQDDVDALIAADRLWDFTRTPRTPEQRELVKKRLATGKHNSWLPKDNGYKPTAREVNEWALYGFGHDSCNAWICVKAECLRLNLPTLCPYCKGDGSVWDSPRWKKKANDWKRSEPPKGKAYQLWETVSEGSPISPMFALPEDLAHWLATSDDYKWKSNDAGTTEDQWMRFICGPGWAPTAIMSSKGFQTGVQAVV